VPANLKPEYFDAEERFKKAETTEDRISALELMLRVIPKHKGTEKMQADIKRRLARLRKDSQKEKASGGHRKPFHHVDREGAGRVVIAGPPNAGKSSLVTALTHATPEVAPYPFTTRIPQPGMMPYEDIQIQLIDTPPLAEEHLEAWQLAMIEQADIVVLIFDVTDPFLLDQTEFVLKCLESRGLASTQEGALKVLFLGNKIDLAGGKDNFSAWKELFEDRMSPIPFSTNSDGDLRDLRENLFKMLDVVRIYTRTPNSKDERDPVPYVLRRGATVLDAAAAIHRDLAEHFKFARIWGEGKYDGQMVERDYVLQDRDLLEVHA
jgi:small GTP-binding protein